MADIPILLLSAGGSRRMGQPKPLLPWGDQTLIEHQIHTLLGTGKPVAVVLGSQSDLVRPIVENYQVTILVNRTWQKGMGNSIAFGISMLDKEFPDAEGVLITLVDQPLLTEDHFEKMCSKFQPGSHQIVVSQSTTGWQGVPALFDRSFFEALQKLNGEQGARTVIRQNSHSVIAVPCGQILQDIDTPRAYQKLRYQFTRRR